MSKAEEARELFVAGANCAQAVLLPFARECGLDRETALRLASGFGGGMGRLREVCGALTGIFMVADLLYGYSDIADKEGKDAQYALIQNLARQFQADTGTILCRELLELPENQISSPISEARTGEYYQQRPCANLVALAAKIMEDYIAGRQPKRDKIDKVES
jgi:C_GCAxxG_C_C family probable redox protein